MSIFCSPTILAPKIKERTIPLQEILMFAFLCARVCVRVCVCACVCMCVCVCVCQEECIITPLLLLSLLVYEQTRCLQYQVIECESI